MKTLSANYSKKAQMKIQQMSFVLIAIMILFIMVALFYFSIRIKTLEKTAVTLREEEAKELVKKIASSPEFSWSRDCDNCIDFDKVMMLKNLSEYKGFWNLDYLVIERVYPIKEGECNPFNYPECNRVSIISTKDFGIPASAFVSLCRWEGSENYEKCEIGRVSAAGKLLRKE